MLSEVIHASPEFLIFANPDAKKMSERVSQTARIGQVYSPDELSSAALWERALNQPSTL